MKGVMARTVVIPSAARDLLYGVSNPTSRGRGGRTARGI
jgi:hypothetical protein